MKNFSDAVKQKLHSYFTQRMGMWDYTRGWLKSDCPFCGKSKKFGVQIEDNKAHCFSCEYRSGVFKSILEYENLKTFQEVYTLINTFEGVGYVPIPKIVEERKSNLELPTEFKLVGIYDSKVAKIVENNLKGRGFKINNLMRAGVGYCASGEYKGRIIIPYYHAGNLIYFNARKFIDIGEKFKNPTESECGIGKSNIIYNIDALYLYDTIRLYESATNCLTMGNNSIGTGGKCLSSWQKNTILASPINKIIIGLDDDAYYEAIRLAMEFSRTKKVKLIRFPPGKDANVLGKKDTINLEKATPWLEYKDYYRMMLHEQTA